MLRRKLLLNLGPLVALMLVTAIVAIWMLQGVLHDLNELQTRGASVVEQEALLGRFKWLVLGLAIVFVVVINVAVIVLLRMGSIVLRPIEELLAGTRALGKEHFEYRVQIDQHDEFDELARAYNSLAEQLQTNEHKRIETLVQVAVTMNHELNNAISIIDLQLAKLRRQSADNPALEKCLLQIQNNLQRVTRTVQALKNVRRIVLTDYAPGTKMLDLERSVEESNPTP